jgi:putative transposase
MTTRDIVDTFQEMYSAAISPAQVSNITEAVMEKIIEWQSRPPDEVYPIIYLDGIVVKIRQDKRVINKAVYVALGVNMQGHKELSGLWLSENEGAKPVLSGAEGFWLSCAD